jgi:hypothetical protein
MRDLEVDGSESVAQLAALMSVSASEAITVGFRYLGRMLTISQGLDFDEIRALAAEFGYRARRAGPSSMGESP